MCIIVYKPKDRILSKNTLENCFMNNNDGAGYMFSENGELIIKKGFFSFNKFYDSYMEDHLKSNVVLHFRISTQGSVEKKNCHPFYVNNTLGFAHNGILGITTPKGSKKSDTNLFNCWILRKLPTDFLTNKAIMLLIEEYIGRDKLAFMDNNGDVTLVNEKAGNWGITGDCEGSWFSNTSYRWKTTYTTGNYAGYGTYAGYGAGYKGYNSTGNKTNTSKDTKESSKTNVKNTLQKHGLEKCEWCQSWFSYDDMSFFYVEDYIVCEHCKTYILNTFDGMETEVVELDPPGYKKPVKDEVDLNACISAKFCKAGDDYLIYTISGEERIAICRSVNEATNVVIFEPYVGDSSLIYMSGSTMVGLFDNDPSSLFNDAEDTLDNLDAIEAADGIYIPANCCGIGRKYYVDGIFCVCEVIGKETVTFATQTGKQVVIGKNQEVLFSSSFNVDDVEHIEDRFDDRPAI